jgi:hypothetical protein
MSAGEEQAEAAVEETGPEPREMSDRTAKGILLLVAVGALWGIVAAAPWVAYVVVGILLDRGWSKAKTRGLLGRQRGEQGGGEPDDSKATEKNLVEALHKMAAPHVFLSALAAELDLSKEEARAALEELDIPIRRAVRIGDGTGVGVHKDDIPPLPRDPGGGPVDGVDQGQPTNQQDVVVRHGEGMTITYRGGRTVDPAAAEEAEQ